jgi:hypothetical protein
MTYENMTGWRSVKSLAMLEKIKVMSYENIENARAKRATKEETIADKEKRDRKRKSPAPETEKATKARRSE